jgi:AcrR family transcriptional regulator
MSPNPQRRVGKETSSTRHAILDAVERLMAAEGYAAVTYRALAVEAGVSAPSVQYYFPALDDIFLAALQRRRAQNLDRLTSTLESSDDVLRAIWDFSTSEATAAVTAEFLALANHRKSIATEIAAITNEVRDLQLAAVRRLHRSTHLIELDAEALVLLLNGVPKLLQLEASAGVDHGHTSMVAAIEQSISY